MDKEDILTIYGILDKVNKDYGYDALELAIALFVRSSRRTIEKLNDDDLELIHDTINACSSLLNEDITDCIDEFEI